MKKIIILYILIISFTGYTNAQQVDVSTIPSRNYQLTPQSPNAFSFLRYDELPVSEYTGIPNISVPIYTIDVDGVKVPLDLSYHASGIKVNDDASWVGLGWNMTFGSVIQIINDEDDFDAKIKKVLPDWISESMSINYGYTIYSIPSSENTSLGNTCLELGKPNSKLSEPTLDYAFWISQLNYFTINNKVSQYEWLFKGPDEGSKYHYDSEPDIFKINLMGEQLNVISKFELNTSGYAYKPSLEVLNKKGYTVTGGLTSIEVRTPSGETYYFVDNSYTTTRTDIIMAGGIGSTRKTLRTWMLNKIRTKNGKEIVFSYTKTPKEVSTVNISHFKDQRVTFGRIEHKGFGFCGIESGLTSVGLGVDYEKRISDSKEFIYYLSSISFPSGKIDFTVSARTDIPDMKKLDIINIKNLSDEPIKKVVFKYDYFLNKDKTTRRLKLTSLVENNVSVHSFAYNTTSLPARNSFEQDYWGYYNGATQNTSLVPNYQRLQKIAGTDGNNLAANLSYAKAGILEEITYPTGGATYFDYELNQFTNYWVPDADSVNNKISKGLGLRIKSVIYKDNKGEEVKKTVYKYEEGKAIIKQSFLETFGNRRTFRINMVGVGGGTPSATITEENGNVANLSSEGVYASNPLASHNGVGYGRVTKYVIDKDENYEGYTETCFHNNPDNVPKHTSSGINVHRFLPVPAFKKVEFPNNGSVKSVMHYDKNKKPVKKQEFEYRNIQSPIHYGARTSPYDNHLEGVQLAGGGLNGADFLRYYRHLLALYPIVDIETLLTKKTETDYESNATANGRKLESTYTYNEYNQINLITVSGNNGTLYTQEYKYDNPYDLTETTSIAQSLKNPYHIKRDFALFEGRYLMSEETVIYGSSQYSASSHNKKNTYYQLYDKNTNLLQKKDINGLTTAYLWSYMGQYPIAEIKNATYEEVKTALSAQGVDVETLSKSMIPVINNDALRKALPKAQISTFTYRPLVGLLTSTEPSGSVSYYEYDTSGRLINVTDNNKKVVSSYSYKYADTQPLRFSIEGVADGLDASGIPIYDIKKMASFNIAGSTGYGNFSYSWYLINNTNEIVFNSQDNTDPELLLNFPANIIGNRVLTCIIKNSVTNEVYEVSKEIKLDDFQTKLTITAPASCQIYKSFTAVAKAQYGSGNFYYKWTVKTPWSEVLFTNTSLPPINTNNEFTYTPTMKSGGGYYITLLCEIIDSKDGKTKTASQTINIID